MLNNKIGGKDVIYEYNINIKEPTYNNVTYLKYLKNHIEDVLNKIIKLVCENKTESEIYNEVSKMPQIEKLCKIPN